MLDLQSMTKLSIYYRYKYLLAGLGSSLDKGITVQRAVRTGQLHKIKGLSQYSEQELEQLIDNIRSAAREYYFKGKVPKHYSQILKNYYRSVLYHIIYDRNYN